MLNRITAVNNPFTWDDIPRFAVKEAESTEATHRLPSQDSTARCEWLQGVPSCTASLPARGLRGALLAWVVSSCLTQSPPTAGSPNCSSLDVMNSPEQDAEGLQSCAASQVCEKQRSLPCVPAEWPWFSMLMALHRWREFPLEVAYTHRGHQLDSYWEVREWNFIPRCWGRDRRDRMVGKLLQFCFVFFFDDHKFPTIPGTAFLVWLNGKSPRNEGWWGRSLSEAPLLPSIGSPSPTSPTPSGSFLLSSDRVSTVCISRWP